MYRDAAILDGKKSMRFLRRPRPTSRSIAVFCGAFHPPTVAHVALAEAARNHVDEVLWVMPECFPHKRYESVALPARLRLLLEATQDPVAIASENLFFSIAQEVENNTAAKVRPLMGEDGARRIVEWDYGLDREAHRDYLTKHLSRFPILTARRLEPWSIPIELAPHFEWLDVDPDISQVSSTLVRERIAAGLSWAELVPKTIEKRVLELYASGGIVSGQ